VKGGKIMKKALFFMILSFMVFSLTGIAYSWQGRMAGMGDPYGLIMDESDFLIHPAKIAEGKGINFYGNYRFNWWDVSKWDYKQTWFNPDGTFSALNSAKNSGHEQDHDALVGVSLPLGPGRLGLFFQYSGKSGDYDGHFFNSLGGDFNKFSLDSDLNDFALRLLYGLPAGSFKIGGEIQIAYRKEKNETLFIWAPGTFLFFNSIIGQYINEQNTFPFMFPYDSKYWEANFKGSLEGAIGPLKMAITGRGGFIFGGDNRLHWASYLIDTPDSFGEDLNLKGKVKGWNVGGDLFLRYPINQSLSLPFLVKVDYSEKTRDGSGVQEPWAVFIPGVPFDYSNKERVFQFEAGGGVDKEITKGTRIAAGVYYNYLWNKKSFYYYIPNFTQLTDHIAYPETNEHRVVLKLAGEKELSPMVSMRMGVNFFYGWVKQDLKFTPDAISGVYEHISLDDGQHWGIGASLGGTVKLQRFALEPFVSGGYEKFDIKGDGGRTNNVGAITSLIDWDQKKGAWFIGGGFSIRY
jgi:hypothetical protein